MDACLLMQVLRSCLAPQDNTRMTTEHTPR